MAPTTTAVISVLTLTIVAIGIWYYFYVNLKDTKHENAKDSSKIANITNSSTELEAPPEVIQVDLTESSAEVQKPIVKSNSRIFVKNKSRKKRKAIIASMRKKK